MQLVWTDEARDDLRLILDYISDRNPTAAEKLEEKIGRTLEGLILHPYMYRPGRVPGTREAVVHPNYIVVYQVGGDVVDITAIMHTRQDYP
jgi:addiction module RelE/StbE family toxin